MNLQKSETSLPQEKETKVVIIEDYKLTRVGLRYALNQIKNINVVAEAESAEEGLEVIKKEQPDVVLMDLGLPNMNGLEATIKVKEASPKTNVVILTSHDRAEEVLASFGSGANAYCLKDIEPGALSDVIKSAAKGACWIDPTVASMALKLFPRPENVEFLSKGTNSDPKGHLTEREQEVLRLLVMGRSNTEIAKELIVSVHTAKAHVCSILQKLCVDDRVQAAVKAIKEGLVKA